MAASNTKETHVKLVMRSTKKRQAGANSKTVLTGLTTSVLSATTAITSKVESVKKLVKRPYANEVIDNESTLYLVPLYFTFTFCTL